MPWTAPRRRGRPARPGPAATDPPGERVTLDGQLVGYWAREATRLDALAASARFGWQRRRYLRKAEEARAQAGRSRAREAARGEA